LLDPPGHTDHFGPVETRRGDGDRPRPDQGAAQCRGQREPAQGAADAARKQQETEQCKRQGDGDQRRPLPRLPKREPAGDAAAEADDQPRRELGTLRLEDAFDRGERCA